MEISYCKKCHEKKRLKHIDGVISDLKTTANTEDIELKCLSYCGPGAKTNFCEIDGVVIQDEDYDAFLEKVGQEYDN